MRSSQDESEASTGCTVIFFLIGVAGISLFMSTVLAPKTEQRLAPVIEHAEPQRMAPPIIAQPTENENKGKARRVRAKIKPRRSSQYGEFTGGSIGFR